MPNIIACFKWIIDEAYIRRTASGTLDFPSADYKISDYDRNAIEEAVRIRNSLGGKVVAMTVGAPEATKGVKDALSRGPDQACFIADVAFSNLEPSQTAMILAEVIGSRFADYDLILCGEGSGDLYSQQVGARLAELLGINCLTFVQKLDLQGAQLIAERRIEAGIEVVAAELPALVTVLPDINVPRIPGVKDTLMAAKKSVTLIKKEELSSLVESRLQIVGMTAARMDRTCEKFGVQAEDIAKFVDALRKKAVIG